MDLHWGVVNHHAVLTDAAEVHVLHDLRECLDEVDQLQVLDVNGFIEGGTIRILDRGLGRLKEGASCGILVLPLSPVVLKPICGIAIAFVLEQLPNQFGTRIVGSVVVLAPQRVAIGLSTPTGRGVEHPRLDLHQGGGHDQELTGLLDIQPAASGATRIRETLDVSKVLLGDRGDWNIGDFHFGPADQEQQQVEGTLEGVKSNGVLGGGGHRGEGRALVPAAPAGVSGCHLGARWSRRAKKNEQFARARPAASAAGTLRPMRTHKRFIVVAAAACATGIFLSTLAQAQAAADAQTIVTLTNGDIIRGTLVSSADADPLVITHPVLGQVSFPRASVTKVATMSVADAGKATADAAAAAGKYPPPPPAPDPDSWFKGWKGLIEGGANGSAGNTETLSFRLGVGAVRETSQTKTAAGFSYNYGTDEGEKSKDNARLEIRNDWLPQNGSKWRPFAQAALDYDTFQDWDYRWSAYGGVGYEWIKTDKVFVLPRAGLGLTQEIGGSDNKIHPEALLGLDAEYKINDTSKLYFNGDSYWALDEIPDYRLLLRAGYETLLDSKSGMTLKLGVEDKYDSTPGDGRKRSDFTYFALIVWPF